MKISNKYQFAVLTSFLFMTGVAAYDANAENFYIRGDVGYTTLNKVKSNQDFYKKSGNARLDSSILYTLGLGYKINDKFRSEVTYNYLNSKYFVNNKTVGSTTPEFKQNIKVHAVLANFIYDIITYGKITPYVGLGIGYSLINSGDGTTTTRDGVLKYKSKKSNNFTYAAMVGSSLMLNEKLNMDFGYRYQMFGKSKGFYLAEPQNSELKPRKLEPESFKIKGHIFTVGFRYNF